DQRLARAVLEVGTGLEADDAIAREVEPREAHARPHRPEHGQQHQREKDGLRSHRDSSEPRSAPRQLWTLGFTTRKKPNLRKAPRAGSGREWSSEQLPK